MQTKHLENVIAAAACNEEQEQMRSLAVRMLGKHGKPKKPLKETRREIAKQLGGISVSQMIIEAR